MNASPQVENQLYLSRVSLIWPGMVSKLQGWYHLPLLQGISNSQHCGTMFREKSYSIIDFGYTSSNDIGNNGS